MADEKFKKSIDPNISAYLRRPIRKLKEAEQDKEASESQWKPIPQLGSSGRGEAPDKYSNPLENVVPKASGQAQTEDGKERDRVLSSRAELIEKLKHSRLSTDMKKVPRKSEELD
jgi:hypothetical protein